MLVGQDLSGTVHCDPHPSIEAHQFAMDSTATNCCHCQADNATGCCHCKPDKKHRPQTEGIVRHTEGTARQTKSKANQAKGTAIQTKGTITHTKGSATHAKGKANQTKGSVSCAGGSRCARSICHHCGALRALRPGSAASAEGQSGAGQEGFHLLSHDPPQDSPDPTASSY